MKKGYAELGIDDQRCPLDQTGAVRRQSSVAKRHKRVNHRSTTYKDPLGKERTWEHAERAVSDADELPRVREQTAC